jgi:hypothetical protein
LEVGDSRAFLFLPSHIALLNLTFLPILRQR